MIFWFSLPLIVSTRLSPDIGQPPVGTKITPIIILEERKPISMINPADVYILDKNWEVSFLPFDKKPLPEFSMTGGQKQWKMNADAQVC